MSLNQSESTILHEIIILYHILRPRERILINESSYILAQTNPRSSKERRKTMQQHFDYLQILDPTNKIIPQLQMS